VSGGLPIGIFSVISEFVVIGIFFDFIGGFIWESSSMSSTTLLVGCVKDGAGSVEAMAGGSRIIVFLVVSVFRVVNIVVFITLSSSLSSGMFFIMSQQC